MSMAAEDDAKADKCVSISSVIPHLEARSGDLEEPVILDKSLSIYSAFSAYTWPFAGCFLACLGGRKEVE